MNVLSPTLTLWIVASVIGVALGQASPPDGPDIDYLGVRRCVGCHDQPSRIEAGTDVTDFVSLAEATVWLERDPHAKAYERLSSPLGQQMARLLGIDVLRDRRCLNCHAGWSSYRRTPPPDYALGVSCEACHGPGSAYRPLHDTAAWRTVSPAEKRALGMTDVRDAETRARLCLSCHLGDTGEGRIVTHAMYAAGHPPLGPFELNQFTQQMPPHWRSLAEKPSFVHREAYEKLVNYRKDERAGVRDAVASALVAMHMSLQMLASELESAGMPGRSPDVAVFDCASCHQELRAVSVQTSRPEGNRRGIPPGRPPRFRWPEYQVRTVAPLIGLDDAELQERLLPLDSSLARRPFGEGRASAREAEAIANWVQSRLVQLRRTTFSPSYGSPIVAAPPSDHLSSDDRKAVRWILQALQQPSADAP